MQTVQASTFIVSGTPLEAGAIYSLSRYQSYADGRIERRGRAISLEGSTLRAVTPGRNEVLIASRADGKPGRFSMWGEYACGLFAASRRFR